MPESKTSKTTSRTTGNDEVSGVDPGGTRSTRPGQKDKTEPKATGGVKTPTTVVSGDRNTNPGPKTKQ
jgi:hypothetical protein